MIRLEEGAITDQGRGGAHPGPGAVWLMSIRFTDSRRRDQDQVRRRVFQALREERARMADDASGDLRR